MNSTYQRLDTWGAMRCALFLVLGCLIAAPAQAQKFTIAAASDLRYTLEEVSALYREQNPGARFDVVYGSSGRMTTQIINGAPFDLFFSADIAFAQLLYTEGLTLAEPQAYAVGRLVLWSRVLDASQLNLEDLATDPRIGRIAIAQPLHAPYGRRAQEAMQATGVWEQVQAKLVFGENIAHAAQMTASGAADVGLIALSLATFPELASSPYALIEDSLHQPLTQAYVITARAEDNPAVHAFAHFMRSEAALNLMRSFGFQIPENN